MSQYSASIIGCGMISGVGLSAPASCSAIRARLNNFQETRFLSRRGDWIVASEVHLEKVWRGLPKLARLAARALQECLDQIPRIHAEQVPLLLCVAEQERRGRIKGLDRDLYREVTALMALRFHSDSRVLAHGQVGGVIALQRAVRWVEDRTHRHVIVAGVDSFLVGPTLAAYDASERLLTADNSNGFIPGEGAAAIIVGPTESTLRLRCLGFGFGTEDAPIASEKPLRADGLTNALKSALDAAGLKMSQIGYRIADVTGEQYGFKEADLAVSRILRDRHEFQDLWHPVDCIGHVGAAVLPCMLGIAFTAAQKDYAPGNPVLLHCSQDDGRRAAVVVGTEV